MWHVPLHNLLNFYRYVHSFTNMGIPIKILQNPFPLEFRWAFDDVCNWRKKYQTLLEYFRC